VAPHPDGKRLLVQRFEGQGVRLFWVPAEGGKAREVKVRRGPLRLAPDVIGGRALDRAGRALVAVASPDSWPWRPAFLDLKTGRLGRLEVEYEGDIYPANWDTAYRKVIGMAYPVQSDLWLFTPQ
jgi:hypothetical protein